MISDLDDQIHDFVEEMLAKGKTPEEASALAGEVIEQSLPEIYKTTIAALDKSRAEMLRRSRAEQAAFEKRNFQRWRKAFDLIETVAEIAGEVGGAFNDHNRSSAVSDRDYVFEAVVSLHARSLLIARESIHLCKGGFADGALSRWRSMHECKVVAAFITLHGQEVALRYLASFDCAALKAARELNEVIGHPGYDEGFSTEELGRMEQHVAAICAEMGSEMRHDYGWAGKVLKNPKPTFASIEANAGLAHERPRYRWASQHTHASARPPNRLLGTVEAQQPLHLVGPSNSGMVDPLQFVALALADITKIMLSVRPTLDCKIYGLLLDHFAGQVGVTALAEEEASLRRARSAQRG
ncbi:DUF5677 domain-containing protein [Roseibacterium beibuensis]|uniref:DUF5677 domain-containing protein n=1 Tax=[Roseibacterium] beibuensis TaxID=1193142 RepID=UPI00217E580E|nr:DUF5677 domain-containing protein [Roseibacterium beibuensis]MCS6624947.1 DUF5677 domain-containing protein [Roseibacterium beibuensis]